LGGRNDQFTPECKSRKFVKGKIGLTKKKGRVTVRIPYAPTAREDGSLGGEIFP